MKFWIGTYARYGGRGIAQAEVRNDRLSLTGWESSMDDPSYLLYDAHTKRLYAACESPTCFAACYDAAGDGLRTITTDNGSEFAGHRIITERLKVHISYRNCKMCENDYRRIRQAA